MSLITFTNLTANILNVPRVDKEIDPNGTIQVEWADSDNLRYDEDINDLITRGFLTMTVPDEEKVFRPVNVYAAVANFPVAATVQEGTFAIDNANADGYLYTQVGGVWTKVLSPVTEYVNVAAFPAIGTVPDGTLAVDAANAAGWLYVASGGAWNAV